MRPSTLASLVLAATAGGFAFAAGQTAASQVPAQNLSAPNLSAKVTFSMRAAPAAVVIPALATASGLPLQVSEAMAGETLLVSVKDATAKDLLDQIAKVSGGSWRQSDQGLSLVVDQSARDAAAARNLARRIAALKAEIDRLSPEAIAKAKAAAAKGGPQNPGVAALLDGGGQNADPVFYQLLSALDPANLAQVQSGRRVVFSTQPLARQLGLPDGAAEDIAAFIHRHNEKATLLKRQQQGGATNSEQDFGVFNGFGGFGGGDPSKTIDEAPYKAIFAVSSLGGVEGMMMGDGLSCALTLYDRKGKILGSDQTMLTSGTMFGMDADDMAAMDAQFGTPGAKAAPPKKFTPLEYSDFAKDFTGYLRSMNSGAPSAPGYQMSADRKAAVIAKLKDPQTWDPLCYAADGIAAYGKAMNRQVVACLPDSYLVGAITSSMLADGAEGFAKRLAHASGVESSLGDVWTTVSPADYAEPKFDRRELAKLVAFFSAHSDPSLDDLSTLALDQFDKSFGGFGMIWLTLFDPTSNMMMFAADWDLLRFYGSLSASQRASMASKNPIPIGALTDVQRSYAEALVYEPGMTFGGSGLRIDAPKQPDDPLLGGADLEMGAEFDSMFGAEGISPQDYRAEPTEVAPNGLPGQGNVDEKDVSKTVLRGAGSSNPAMSMFPMTLEMLAYEQVSESAGQGDASFPKKFTIGTQRTIYLRIYVSSDTFYSGTLTDNRFPDSTAYTLQTLPADLKAQYDKILARVKKEMASAQAAPPVEGAGGGAPPK